MAVQGTYQNNIFLCICDVCYFSNSFLSMIRNTIQNENCCETLKAVCRLGALYYRS